MIWYTERLKVISQPNDSTITLIGQYNTPQSGRDIIEIIVHIADGNDTDKSVTLYTHNPTMLKSEDPTVEDVLHKYHAKVVKIRSSLINKEYATLLKK